MHQRNDRSMATVFVWTLLLVSLIAAPISDAAIAFVQSKNYSPNKSALASLSATFTSAQTAGNFNVVAVGWGTTSATVSSITDTKGNVYTLAVGPTVTSFGNASIYYAKNIAAAAAGVNKVTVTFSAAVPWPDVRIAEYSGIVTTNPLDVSAVATGTGALGDSGFATTTNANDLLIGSNWVSTGSTGPGAGYTQREISGWDGDILEDRIVSTTGAYNATAPLSPSGNWIMQMAAFKGVPTTPGTPAISGISGTVGAGQTVTVSGSGFGSHASYNNVSDTWNGGQYLNFRFKDFEDATLNSHGFYAQSGGSPWTPTATDLSIQSGGPTNSTSFMRRMYGQENGGLSADVAGAGNQLYTTFKFMVPSGTQSGKLFRFYADSPQNNVWISTGCSDLWVRGFSECTATSCANAQVQWGTGPQLTAGVWHRLEFWVNADTNTVTASVDGAVNWTMSNWLNSTLALNGHTVDYPNMIDGARDASCPPVGSYNYDDIFVDFTQARVEIGDASTWAAVQHKEVQIPVSWSASSVQIKVNKGEFTTGTQAWLYVVDSNGAVNPNGTPVTIQ